MRFKCRVVSNVSKIVLTSVLGLLVFIVGCRESDKLKITGFTPSSAHVGDTVTITGKKFSATASSNTVKFNGTTAVVTSSTSTQIVTSVPVGATTGRITVTVGNKTAESSTDFTVSESSSPTISGFSPASGVTGDAVTIMGTNFSATAADNAVKFNGTTAVVDSATSTQIVAGVPAGATTGAITVTVNGSTATSSGTFTVVSPPAITGFSPESGQEGDTVTITGANFSATAADNAVKFNGTSAVVTDSSATQITATVPEGAATGRITVTVGGYTGTSSSDFTVVPSASITDSVFGGQYEDASGNTMPCYWIGEERVELPIGSNTYGWALSPVAIAGTTVYTAGYYYSETSHGYLPCYWAGTTRYDLPLPDGAGHIEVSGIAVSNGTVYTVGYYDNNDMTKTIPCYWVDDDAPVLLTDPLEIGRAYAYAITVSNGTVYVAGDYLLEDADPDNPPYQACYWEGGVLVDLPTPSVSTDIHATAITVSAGTVYTAGTYYYYDGISTKNACYWIDDDNPTILGSPAGVNDGSYASGIAVSGGAVYVSGEYWHDGIDRVCYWKDGELMDVTSPAGSVDQYSSAIMAIDDTVYIGGGYNYYYDEAYYWRVCLWTDTDITTLNDEAQDAYINSSSWWWD